MLNCRCSRIVLVVLTGWAAALFAQQTFPAEGWLPTPDPIASPQAVKGGSMSLWGGPYPKSLNYFLEQNTTTEVVFGLMYETLLASDSITREFEPHLACRWTISADKKVFTFELDPRAKWSDGKPITAEDVAWTFNTARDPKSLTGQIQGQLERIERVEVVNERTVRFYAKEVSFLNIYILGGLQVLPKHSMDGKDFNRINFEFPVVSGPYRVERIEEGSFLTLTRRNDWWLQDAPSVRGMYNFDRIKLVFYTEREDAFAAFRKGMFDLYTVYTSRMWLKQTSGGAFDQNWILKKQVFNHQPRMLQGYAMNLTREVFQDVRVRRALAHLYDRHRMNRTLMYNSYAMHRSYFEDVYDAQHPNPHPEVAFDPEEAARLLDEAGWLVNPETGFREKDGKPLAFTFLSRSAVEGKFLAIYNEALQAAGIKMDIERKDWAAWIRDVDEKNFDMTVAVWGPSYPKDPRNLWGSAEADRPSSANYTGFKNKKVDELIDKYSSEFDAKKRDELLREIDTILVDESPYILGWYNDNVRLLYWNKFGMPSTVLGKFSNDEAAAFVHWWEDPSRREELEESKELDLALPEEPVEVHFDQAFNPASPAGQ